MEGGVILNWKEAKAVINRDPEVVAELEKLQPRYQIISQIIQLRKEMDLTQKELARLIGTKQSNISRLESGNYNPSVEFLSKIAHTLGKKLDIRFN